MTSRDDLIYAAADGVPEKWKDALYAAMELTRSWERHVVIHDEGEVWEWKWFDDSGKAMRYAISLGKRGVDWAPFNVWLLLNPAITEALVHEVPDWDVVFP